jgi:hypothetical protein
MNDEREQQRREREEFRESCAKIRESIAYNKGLLDGIGRRQDVMLSTYEDAKVEEPVKKGVKYHLCKVWNVAKDPLFWEVMAYTIVFTVIGHLLLSLV